MTDLEEVESLVGIIADELNIKRIVILDTKLGRDEIEVVWSDSHLHVYKNDGEVDAPNTAVAAVNRFLRSRS